jgi:hypothetical protein
MSRVGSLSTSRCDFELMSLGFTSQRLPAEEDHTLPERFSLGLVRAF